MRTIFTDTDSAEMAPCVATIGFFDGVHRGHRYLIKSVTDCAAASPELQSTVITFDRHPRQVPLLQKLGFHYLGTEQDEAIFCRYNVR